MFVGIQFLEQDGGGVALVHRKWLTPRKNEVWWPPFKQQELHDRSLKKGESPNENWILYTVQRSFFEEDDYIKAIKKIKQAEVTSDIASEEESVIVNQKRKIIPPKRLFSSDDEDEEPLPKIRNLIEQKKRTGSKENTLTSIPQPAIPSSPKGLPKTSSKQFNRSSTGSTISTVITPSSLWLDSPKIISERRSSAVSTEDCDSIELTGFKEHEKSLPCTDDVLALLKENNAYLKKTVQLLVTLKAQNDQILNTFHQKKTSTGLILDLPDDIPVSLPIKTLREIRVIEEYLESDGKLSSLASYFATLGGRDKRSKINSILRNLFTDKVASSFSFFGSRNQKKPFQNLRLRKVVVNAILATCTATECEVDDAIKVWLKHAPKRQAVAKNKAN